MKNSYFIYINILLIMLIITSNFIGVILYSNEVTLHLFSEEKTMLFHLPIRWIIMSLNIDIKVILLGIIMNGILIYKKQISLQSLHLRYCILIIFLSCIYPVILFYSMRDGYAEEVIINKFYELLFFRHLMP